MALSLLHSGASVIEAPNLCNRTLAGLSRDRARNQLILATLKFGFLESIVLDTYGLSS